MLIQTKIRTDVFGPNLHHSCIYVKSCPDSTIAKKGKNAYLMIWGDYQSLDKKGFIRIMKEQYPEME